MTESAERSTSFAVLVLALAWSIVGLIAAALPLRNWDYWFHITVGRLIATHGALPSQNVFGYSAPIETPVLVHAWIGELWLYELHQFGGLAAALGARNACALTVWGMLAWCVYRLSDRHAAATAALVVVFGVVFLAVTGFTGPQMFVWPVFGVLTMLFVASRTWERRHWTLAVATGLGALFWANAAPNFWVPAALAAIFAGVAQFEGASSRRNWCLLAAAVGIAAMFATPQGAGALISLLRGEALATWLVLGAPLGLAPVVRAFLPTFEPSIHRIAAAVVVAFVVVTTVAVQPWSEAHQAIPLLVFGDAVRSDPPLRGYGPSTIPVEAVEVLKSWGSQPRVYAAPHLSGYLLFELQDPAAPQRQVWPVPDWSPTDDVVELERALTSNAEVFRGVLQQFDVRAVILTPELGGVAPYLQGAPDWVEVGTWPSGTLYMRERPSP